jgi:hypothetical protein
MPSNISKKKAKGVTSFGAKWRQDKGPFAVTHTLSLSQFESVWWFQAIISRACWKLRRQRPAQRQKMTWWQW